MKSIRTYFAPVFASGDFFFHEIRRTKKETDALISPLDVGTHQRTTRSLTLRLFTDPLPPVPDDPDTLWAQYKIAWIIKNPDDTFWWDTLSDREKETRHWWGAPERAAKREALGFSVVPLQFVFTD